MSKFLKESSWPIQQDACSGGSLIGKMPSNKINTETGESEDNSPDSSSYRISDH